MVAHLSWATWAIRSQLLICLVRSERIAHRSSFDLSEMSDWAKERIPSPAQTTLWGSSCGQDSNPWQADLSQEHWQLHHCTARSIIIVLMFLVNKSDSVGGWPLYTCFDNVAGGSSAVSLVCRKHHEAPQGPQAYQDLSGPWALVLLMECLQSIVHRAVKTNILLRKM